MQYIILSPLQLILFHQTSRTTLTPHNPTTRNFANFTKVHTVLANGVPNSKLPKCYGALHQDPPLSCLKKSSKSDFTPQTPRPRPGPFLEKIGWPVMMSFPEIPQKKHVPKHAAPKTCRVLWVDFPVGGADAARRTEA